jgi:hypothetical protein
MTTLDTLAEGWRDDAAEDMRNAMITKGESAADAGHYHTGELTQAEAAEITRAAFVDAATDDAHALDHATVCAIRDAVDATDWVTTAAEILSAS